jgi:hypothetical protein
MIIIEFNNSIFVLRISNSVFSSLKRHAEPKENPHSSRKRCKKRIGISVGKCP